MKTRILLLIICFFATIVTWSQAMPAGLIQLDTGWQFRRVGDSIWRSAEVPGTIHTDLMRHGLIPDPYIEINESKVQWVEKESWEYRLRFDAPPVRPGGKWEMTFQGIDTDADVMLNGRTVLHTDNMFRTWTITTAGLGARNELRIVFQPSAVNAFRQKQRDRPTLPESERVYVRKAQYQFGWDWGPRLVTCGIWKPVTIRTVYDFYDLAYLKETHNNLPGKVGLVIEPDSAGAAFYFTVDSVPTFMKGANWIPPDNFMPRAQKRRYYETQLTAAKEAGLNMLRVWGGGVYEDDRFYDLCDSLGIYVWQDFMFAGALYPADSAFLRNVAAEVRDQVRRLRHHPCIALWCGNNEIEEAWFNWGWQKQFNYSPQDSMLLWGNYKKIFHELIPSILKQEDPDRAYWPSSPSLGWGRDSAYKRGDVHYWGVWWGGEPVSRYEQKIGRFLSEYGMQGMPDIRTIRAFAGSGPLDTADAALRVHQKHPFGYQALAQYIREKFPVPKKFENLVYVSQLMQADAVGTAIDAHRRNAPYTMGSLFWQWNDCWPVTSWSAMDWYGRKKALFYEVKRAFDPLRLTTFWKADTLWSAIAADYLHTFNLNLEIALCNFDGKLISSRRQEMERFAALQLVGKGAMTADTVNQFLRLRLLGVNDSMLAERIVPLSLPKNRSLKPPHIEWKLSGDQLWLTTDTYASGVEIIAPDGTWLEDNFFDLLPGQPKFVRFRSPLPLSRWKKEIRLRSLADVQQH